MKKVPGIFLFPGLLFCIRLSVVLLKTYESTRKIFDFYIKKVPRTGIEPVTRGFSVLCSTNWAIWASYKRRARDVCFVLFKLRGQDLNLWPSGYEPDELPDCSIPRYEVTSDNTCYQKNGQRWIRTTEAICSRFTVCPLWPLGNLPI